MAEEVKDEGTRQAIKDLADSIKKSSDETIQKLSSREVILELATSIKESSEQTIQTLSSLSQSETATEKITQAQAHRET